jgi:hypothetical protein
MRQSTALSALLSGQSVFLTGEPGAGKSHTVKEFLRRTDRNIAITASTGIAATQIGGMTIHAWSGIGTREALRSWDVDGIARGPAGDRIRSAEMLIIDEVSMLSGDVVQMVDFVCRGVRGDERPFGGLQVVFVGDFFQLPPVKSNAWPFAFDAPVWKALNPMICYLTEQHRQSDATFLGALSAIRRGHGDSSSAVRAALASRSLYGEAPRGVPVLFTHKFNVDTMNDDRLGKLGGSNRTFRMTGEGPEPLIKALMKGCQSPEVLQLKNGAEVMFTRNDPNGGFVNRTLGTVFDAHRPDPLVRLRNGSIVAAELASWEILAPVDKKPGQRTGWSTRNAERTRASCSIPAPRK